MQPDYWRVSAILAPVRTVSERYVAYTDLQAHYAPFSPTASPTLMVLRIMIPTEKTEAERAFYADLKYKSLEYRERSVTRR